MSREKLAEIAKAFLIMGPQAREYFINRMAAVAPEWTAALTAKHHELLENENEG